MDFGDRFHDNAEPNPEETRRSLPFKSRLNKEESKDETRRIILSVRTEKR